MISATLVPFDPHGNLMHYPQRTALLDDAGWLSGLVEPRWRPNVPFDAVLTLVETRCGRAARYLTWQDERGRVWPMFVADLVDVLREAECGVVSGVVRGRWMVRKRGENYGLTMVR